jgi:predicted RNA binding protein YcfA (HicA-like mRNA interferase family)
MTELPSVRPDRLQRALQRAGFYVDHASGSHYVLKHPTKRQLRVVPYHTGDIKRGVLRSILRQSELTTAELVRLL